MYYIRMCSILQTGYKCRHWFYSILRSYDHTIHPTMQGVHAGARTTRIKAETCFCWPWCGSQSIVGWTHGFGCSLKPGVLINSNAATLTVVREYSDPTNTIWSYDPNLRFRSCCLTQRQQHRCLCVFVYVCVCICVYVCVCSTSSSEPLSVGWADRWRRGQWKSSMHYCACAVMHTFVFFSIHFFQHMNIYILIYLVYVYIVICVVLHT